MREDVKRRRRSRALHAPRSSFEELEIRTEDGVALRAVLDDPPEGVAFRGTCVLAHALCARKSEFGDRAQRGLAQALGTAGFRTIAFDFRGHGDSALSNEAGGSRDVRYDDLVRHDLPTVVACAQARNEGRPVVVVGHGLGGHVALAAQGAGRMNADGMVVIEAAPWVRSFEPSTLRWAAKVALARGVEAAIDRLGVFPARMLRIGSDDTPASLARDLLGFLQTGAWQSADGSDDYLASLTRVVIPVGAMTSDMYVVPSRSSSIEAMVRRCAGPMKLFQVRDGESIVRFARPSSVVRRPDAFPVLVDAVSWAMTTAR